jgi:hypothetical protein
MRQISIFILLLFASSCNAQDRNIVKSESEIIDNHFATFISSFHTKDLPFSINCTNDYLRREIFDPNTTEHRGNIYKSVELDNLVFLQDESVGRQNIDFRYTFKIMETDIFYGVVYIKDSIDIDGFADPSWLILNTYTRTGKFISKLKIAGDHFDIIDMFCEITPEHEIITTSYFFLPDSDNNENLIFARQCVEKYEISDKGIIKRKTSKEKNSYFKVDGHGCYEEFNH